MRMARWWITGLLMSGLAMACGPSSNTDMDSGTDGSMNPDGSADPDGSTDGETPGGEMCGSSRLIDLTTQTPGADGLVHYRGDSNSAPASGGIALPAGCAWQDGTQGYQVAFRYRMRTGGILVASTATANTQEEFDTVVHIADSCDAGRTSLACNDDESNQTLQSTAITTASLAAGTEVVIIVGGYVPSVEGATAKGRFELVVGEVQPVAAGEECDGTAPCVEGSQCLYVRGSTERATCQQDGTEGALCRASEPKCDSGLSTGMIGSSCVCRSTVAAGATCDLQQRFNVCAAGASCVRSGSDTLDGTCMPDGVQGGACRTGDSPCDEGLTCAKGMCLTAVAAGATCDPAVAANACASGSVCLRTSASAAVCTATVAEVEPNNAPATAQGPAVASAGFTAAINPMDDVDCFSLTVPANGSLVLTTGDGYGGCPGNMDTVVRLYDAAGTMIAENDDISRVNYCSMIDGSTSGPAHALAAGNYVACVSSWSARSMIASYTLSAEILAP